MKLLTPKFQRSEAIGSRSPIPVTASVRLRPTVNPEPPQAQVAHNCCVDAALDSSIGYPKADVGLAAQNGRCKRVARYREIQWFGSAVYVRIEVAVEIHVDVAEGHLLRERHVPAGRHLVVIKNISE